MKKTVMMFVGLAGLAMSVPGMAGQNSAVVHTSDLNLNSQTGRDALDRRIIRAANSICVVRGDRSLTEFRESRRCSAGAIAGAHGQIAVVASR